MTVRALLAPVATICRAGAFSRSLIGARRHKLNVAGFTFSEQRKLFLSFRPRMGGLAVPAAADPMLLPQTSNQLRNALVIRLREECTVVESLAIACHQMWELLFQEGKKHRGGTWFQEERIGINVLASRFSSSLHQRLQIM